MSEVINGNLNDVLSAISAVQDKNVYPVYIPSLKKNVMFRELNTKQEKMLVKTIVDSPIYKSEFIFAIKEIIAENCAEELDINTLTIIDKTAICLTMRMKSIGNEFEFTFKNTKKSKTIDISEYVEKFKKLKVPEDKEIGTDDIKVVCGYPTVGVEYALEKEFRSNVADLSVNSVEEARDAIGNVFTNELVKYIKEITIINDGVAMKLNMDDYTFGNRLTILGRIGHSVTGQVIEYIEEANKLVRDTLTIELELDEADKKKFKTEKLTSVLEAGSDFFIIS